MPKLALQTLSLCQLLSTLCSPAGIWLVANFLEHRVFGGIYGFTQVGLGLLIDLQAAPIALVLRLHTPQSEHCVELVLTLQQAGMRMWCREDLAGPWYASCNIASKVLPWPCRLEPGYLLVKQECSAVPERCRQGQCPKLTPFSTLWSAPTSYRQCAIYQKNNLTTLMLQSFALCTSCAVDHIRTWATKLHIHGDSLSYWIRVYQVIRHDQAVRHAYWQSVLQTGSSTHL